MKCCPNCFKDKLAKELVFSLAEEDQGKCDFCGARVGRLLEVAPESELAEQLGDLLSVFSVANSEEGSYPSLFDAFIETWSIFESESKVAFNSMIQALFPNNASINELLRESVCLDPSPSAENPFQLNFFGENDWNKFAYSIQHVQRYHAEIVNRGILARLLNALAKEIDQSTGMWYRARRWNGKSQNDLSIKELREPGPDKAGDGRMAPRGVPCLYISNSVEGAMSEIRASRYDEVAILSMRPVRKLRILDLSRVDEISPFDENVDCKELASNIENLRQMKADLVKPMRASDDPIDYVPTQYIADFARSIGFDGIGYSSVLHEKDGMPSYNIASFHGFDDAFSECDIALYRIENFSLQVNLIKSRK